MSETMKSVAVLSAGDVRIVHDVPVPTLSPYEALVRIHACGFCNGTDSQIIAGTLTKEEGMGEYPTILGHEAAGEVVKLGEKVRHIRLGDRYIRPNLKPDQLNGYSKTYGNMSEYGVVVDRKAMLEDGYAEKDLPFPDSMGAIPRDFDYADGGVLLSLLECHSAVENFGIRAGMDVLVYGAGPMGLGMLSFIRQKGVNSLTVVDGEADRLAHAAAVAKVDRTIDFTKEKTAEVLEGRRFDVVLDCVGLTSIILEATKFLKPGGKVGVMGVLKSDDFVLDLSRLQNNTSLQMLNFPYRRFDSLGAVLELIRQGKINPKDYYSHVMPVEEIHKAIELVHSKQAFKVILTF